MAETEQFDFAARLKELEAITAWFEQEELNLDEGLEKFERGMALVADLRQHLGKVENRVEQIKRKFDQVGSPGESDTPEQPAAL